MVSSCFKKPADICQKHDANVLEITRKYSFKSITASLLYLQPTNLNSAVCTHFQLTCWHTACIYTKCVTVRCPKGCIYCAVSQNNPSKFHVQQLAHKLSLTFSNDIEYRQINQQNHQLWFCSNVTYILSQRMLNNKEKKKRNSKSLTLAAWWKPCRKPSYDSRTVQSHQYLWMASSLVQLMIIHLATWFVSPPLNNAKKANKVLMKWWAEELICNGTCPGHWGHRPRKLWHACHHLAQQWCTNMLSFVQMHTHTKTQSFSSKLCLKVKC